LKIKFKKILPFAIGGCLLAAAIALGSTVSYLADYEDATNVITIGDINLEVSEGSYEDSEVVAAGQTLPKAPTIKNTGTNDEYVFFSVAIPKETVTLLYEQTEGTEHKEGTKYGEASLDEIFKTIADGRQDGASATEVSYTEYSSVNGATLSAPQVFVQYNKGLYDATAANAKKGWVYLGRKADQTFDTGANPPKYDVYWFGYNRKLSKNDTTIELFDRIQLKSFIDEELVSKETVNDVTTKNDEEVKVIIKAYGIQADNLGITGLPEGNGIMTDDKVKEIYDIVNRKQGTT